MPSNIDFSKPIYGSPTTQSVRDNFQIAQTEITDLQTITEQGPFVPLVGGIMTGFLELNADPRGNMEAATKQYVDALAFGASNSIPDAPKDGMFYARGGSVSGGNNDWSTNPLFTSLLIGADTATRYYKIGYDSTYNFFSFVTDGSDTLRYNRGTKVLDLVFNNAVAANFSNSAIVFSKFLTLNADPTTALGAATKQYVDTKAGAYLPLVGGTLTGNLIVSGPAIPADRLNVTVSAPEYNVKQGGHFAINSYVSSTGPAWKYLEAGYAANIYQSNTGSIAFTIFPSGAANAVVATAVIAQFNTDGTWQAPQARITGGRIISQGTVNPSVSCYDLSGTVSCLGMWNGGGTLWLGAIDGNGVPATGYLGLVSNQFLANVQIRAVQGIAFGASSNWAIYIDANGHHINNHAANWYEHWNVSSGVWSWNGPGGGLMNLDSGGNLTILGKLTTSNGQLTVNSGGMSVSGASTFFNTLEVKSTFYPTGGIVNVQGMSSFGMWFSGSNQRIVGLEPNAYIIKNDSAEVQVTAYQGGHSTLVTNGGWARQQADGGFSISNGWGAKPGGGPWADSSDIRIKTIEGNYTQGLAAIVKLEPRIYSFLGNEELDNIVKPMAKSIERNLPMPLEPMPKDWVGPPKTMPSHHAIVAELGHKFIGLVAQEVEDHMPEMVSLASGTIDGVHVDDIRQLDTSALAMAFINAFKEIDARLRAGNL